MERGGMQYASGKGASFEIQLQWHAMSSNLDLYRGHAYETKMIHLSYHQSMFKVRMI